MSGGGVMVSKLDQYMGFHEAVLSVRGQRQQMLASNIANADTPNYKARDIDFSAAMTHALNRGAGVSTELNKTAGSHLNAQGSIDGSAPLYRSSVQGNVDGNTVDMDVELILRPRALGVDGKRHVGARQRPVKDCGDLQPRVPSGLPEPRRRVTLQAGAFNPVHRRQRGQQKLAGKAWRADNGVAVGTRLTELHVRAGKRKAERRFRHRTGANHLTERGAAQSLRGRRRGNSGRHGASQKQQRYKHRQFHQTVAGSGGAASR